MARARLLAPWVEDGKNSAVYHVVSRFVDSKLSFNDEDKDQLIGYMRMYEEFCGVRVLTYCVMRNHFHILVEIPPSCAQKLDDEALLERLKVLYSDEYIEVVREQLEVLRRSKTTKKQAAYWTLREQYTKRMWDLGLFIKTIKQRFSTSYNKAHGRRGGLWTTRYKSVLVENGFAVRAMAAYVERNPVRARIVEDPKDYRWCGYAEAVAGGQLARYGLARLTSDMNHGMEVDGWADAKDIMGGDWRRLSTKYRHILFEECAEITRKKSHFFVSSLVVGSKEFVASVLAVNKEGSQNNPRTSGVLKPKGVLSKSGLYAMKQPRYD